MVSSSASQFNSNEPLPLSPLLSALAEHLMNNPFNFGSQRV